MSTYVLSPPVAKGQNGKKFVLFDIHMGVQTEIGGMEILQEIEIHEISEDTASIMYLLMLANSLDHFQLKHLKGKFDNFEIDPEKRFNVAHHRSLRYDFAEIMEEDGLLEDVGDSNSKYDITEKGQKILNLYCLGLKILSQELITRAGRLYVTADSIQKSEGWSFETSDFIEDEEQAKKLEEILENMEEKTGKRPKLGSKVLADFFEETSKFDGVEANKRQVREFILIEIFNFDTTEYFENFNEVVEEDLDEKYLESASSIEAEEEVKYYKDVFRMVRTTKNSQPQRIRSEKTKNDEEKVGFTATLEEAHRVEEIGDEAKEILEKIEAEKDFEDLKDQLGLR
jgi:hypothetical protein